MSQSFDLGPSTPNALVDLGTLTTSPANPDYYRIPFGFTITATDPSHDWTQQAPYELEWTILSVDASSNYPGSANYVETLTSVGSVNPLNALDNGPVFTSMNYDVLKSIIDDAMSQFVLPSGSLVVRSRFRYVIDNVMYEATEYGTFRY